VTKEVAKKEVSSDTSCVLSLAGLDPLLIGNEPTSKPGRETMYETAGKKCAFIIVYTQHINSMERSP
jgi:hypothetical protein